MDSRNRLLLALPIAAAVGWAHLSRGDLQQDLNGLGSAAVGNQLSRAFEQVASDVRDSVVRIESIRRLEPSPDMRSRPRPFLDSPFREFFGQDFFEQFQFPDVPQGPYVQEGLGSGFVLTADGYIVTNNHVVRDADEVDVHMPDGKKMRATIAGTDAKTDIAILKIDATELRPVRLGDSDELRPGQWVIAAGNPFGLSSTITAGIVSAVGRSNVGIAEYEDFIQTDAAINPGNSGGPLLNLNGEVVGVSSAIFTRSGGYMGIGFAIPINMLRSIQADLIDNGTVTRGLLGVIIQDLDEGLAQSFGYEETNGVLVSEVREDSPAEKAGLQEGDIIVSFDGEVIKTKEQLRFRVAGTVPGSTVSIEAFRDGKVRRFSAVIGELSPSDVSAHSGPGKAERDLGVEVQPLTPETRAQLGLPASVEGVLISRVEPLSTAARAGLQPGEVITRVDGEPITSVAQFRTIIADLDLSKGVRISARTGSGKRFVFLRSR